MRYCINLERRPDRKTEFIERYNSKENIVFFNAIDLRTKTYEFDKIESKISESSLLVGEKGCFLSHLKLWKEIKTTSIIFEDDCHFNENFKGISEIFHHIPQDADIVYIGGTPTPNYIKPTFPTLVVNTHFVKKIRKNALTTHAYIITEKGANKLIRLCEKTSIKPLDGWLFSLPITIYELKEHTCYSPLNYKTDIQIDVNSNTQLPSSHEILLDTE